MDEHESVLENAKGGDALSTMKISGVGKPAF